MQKSVSESLRSKREFIASKYFLQKILSNYRRKSSAIFTVETLGRHHLNQVIQVNLTRNWMNQHYLTPDTMRREKHVLSKMHNQGLNVRKHWTNSNRERLYE